jgi:hypothetical protein
MQYKLSDSSIAQIVQLLQLGILTGTDVSDQMRTLRLSVDKNKTELVPSEDYLEMFKENLAKLQEAADNLSTQSFDGEIGE